MKKLLLIAGGAVLAYLLYKAKTVYVEEPIIIGVGKVIEDFKLRLRSTTLGQISQMPPPGVYVATISPYPGVPAEVKPEVPAPTIPAIPETMFSKIEAIAEYAKTRPGRYGSGF